MAKLREQLETAGCTIIEETNNKIVARCKPDILQKGMVIEGAKNIKAERGELDKEVTITLEKEEE
jgi:hypothetical protein